MKFTAKTRKIIEANQYRNRGECVLGVQTREDGTAYVTTIQGQQVTVEVGEWIVQESDGIHYYPIANGEFQELYE